MDLSARIENLIINPAIMNASGILSFAPVLKKISEFQIGALVTKSANYDGKEGFENPVVAKCSDEAWLNAVGLPNSGCESKKKELEEIYPHFRSIEKPLIVSLFESDAEKLGRAVAILNDVCNAFELNFSCPNLMPGEKTGIVIGRDPALVKKYTRAAKEATEKPLIIKLSPGPYMENRERIKEIALSAASAGADAISAINTVPGGMKIDIFAKKPVLTANYGGLSGKAIKPIGIGCVYTIYEALQSNGYKTPIIGIGGIETAEDIIEYIEAGASAVAIGTVLVGMRLEHIKNYLSSLTSNMETILESLGLNSLLELRGVAHE
jgi:dihydroorotate dehydrogenase (NAD+) catalytic subunit